MSQSWMVHFNVQLNQINSPFYLLIFSGFLLPYVCWHCNTGCSSQAVTPSCYVKLRWPSSPKSSSHNDFIRSHLGRFWAQAPNQGVSRRQCKINSNLNFNLKKLLKAVFCEWSLLHLMRKIKFLAFYVCCFCSHGLAYKQSNERNETNLLAPLTLLLLLFYFFCFNLLSFSFDSIGFTGKNNVVDS